MHRSRFVALLLALCAVTTSGTNAQGIGGLIKKKAAEAVKGPDKTAAKPEQASSSSDNCPVTEDAVTRFLKGLEVERADRAAFKAQLGALRPKNEWLACRAQAQQSPEGMKAAQSMGNIPDNVSQKDMQKILEKTAAELDKVIKAKCGVEPEEWSNSRRYDRLREAEKAGAKAAGMEEECYRLLKERAIPFCSLSQAQQQQATVGGIKVPGASKGFNYVYTAAEAKALAPHCATIMTALKAIDSIVVLEKGGA